MGPGVFILALFTWLLPVMVDSGVLNRDGQESCREYTQDGLIYVDCSDLGLTELSDDLNYQADVLLLNNNNFVSFPSQLEQFTRLESLDLSGNHLSTAPAPYFELFSSLRTLNLSNNNYETWTTNELDLSIRRLDLSRNKINKIDEKAFSGMDSLYFLDLSENRINDLPPTLFADINHLDTLILSRNYFSGVPKFQSSSLKSLHLSNCQIAQLDVDSLSKMNSLLEIDLSINQIESVPDDLDSDSLEKLYLSYNEITSLTDRTLASLPRLAVLDFRGNAFREVWPISHFAFNPHLKEVLVKGNRWVCDGFSVNLLLTYEFFTKEPPKIYDKSSLICYYPSNVTQLSWQEAYIRTWHSESTTTESYTLFAVMIGIFIGIVLTSLVCRGLMALNKPDPPRPQSETTVLNLNGTVPQARVESVVMRVPLHDEDLPPSYDEALLMPRLNSFHSLPDFVDEEEDMTRGNRRSRSIGDLTESRPQRYTDRRSIRRTVEIRITENE